MHLTKVMERTFVHGVLIRGHSAGDAPDAVDHRGSVPAQRAALSVSAQLVSELVHRELLFGALAHPFAEVAAE